MGFSSLTPPPTPLSLFLRLSLSPFKPFVAEMEQDERQPALCNNLFRAPLFAHRAPSTDFLLVCVDSSTSREDGDSAAGGKGGKNVGGKSIKIFGPGEKGKGGKDAKAPRRNTTTTVTAVLREIPPNRLFLAGQTEPHEAVPAPHSQDYKRILNNYVTHCLADLFDKLGDPDVGVELKEIWSSMFTHGAIMRDGSERPGIFPGLSNSSSLRSRMKEVAEHRKDTKGQRWYPKRENYRTADDIARRGELPPEKLCALLSCLAADRKLRDLGINKLQGDVKHDSAKNLVDIPKALTEMLNREAKAKEKAKALRAAVTSQVGGRGGGGGGSGGGKSIDALTGGPGGKGKDKRLKYMEMRAKAQEERAAALRKSLKIARAINEQLKLTSWHMSSEFVTVHLRQEAYGMLKLTGLGDPSGCGKGFSFLRQPIGETKNKTAKQAAEEKKLLKSGGLAHTDKDLRKLTMDQMKNILIAYGMSEEVINKAKRWDRTRLISELTNRQGQDAGELSKYQRKGKPSVALQYQEYKTRCRGIWERQAADLGDEGGAASSDEESEGEGGGDGTKSDSESDIDLELEPAKASAATAASSSRGGEDDARELARWRREQEAKAGAGRSISPVPMGGGGGGISSLSARSHAPPLRDGSIKRPRRVVKRTIRRIDSDGRESVEVQFILDEKEVQRVLTTKGRREREQKKREDDEEEMREKDAAADRATSPSNNSGKITISKSAIKLKVSVLGRVGLELERGWS